MGPRDGIARIPVSEIILQIVANIPDFILILVDHFIKGLLERQKTLTMNHFVPMLTDPCCGFEQLWERNLRKDDLENVHFSQNLVALTIHSRLFLIVITSKSRSS